MAPIFLGASAVDFPGPVYLGAAQVYAPPVAFPSDSAAVWLVMGQSNAQGRAPRSQDPAKADVAAAVDYFDSVLPRAAADYAGPHPWLRMSRPGILGNASINGRLESLSVAGDAPTSTTHVYTVGNFGIPAQTPGFGAEIALVREVLEGARPATWRDDADPRLFVLKAANGSTSVDQFREGGDLAPYVLEHLTQAATGAGFTNLAALAASKTVLLQGILFVIGETDSNAEDAGDVAAGSFARRFGEWIRQVRGLLGHPDLPVVLAEIYDNAGALAKSKAVNDQMAALAASIPNAAVLDSAGWGVADSVHYDAAAMDDLGAQAFAALRTYGRAEDGLVTAYPYVGSLGPVVLVPPVMVDVVGNDLTFAVRANASGTLRGVVRPLGATLPTPAEIAAAPDFSVALTADGDFVGSLGSVYADADGEVHSYLEAADARTSAVVRSTYWKNGKFIATQGATLPDGLTPTADGIAGALNASSGGTFVWSVFAGGKPWIAVEDVIDRALAPTATGSVPIVTPTSSNSTPFAVTGLAAGDYVLFVAILSGEGKIGEAARVPFTVA